MVEPLGVLFVCTGNICRSPTAAGVFERMVQDAGLAERVRIDSAATHNYHPDKPPDPRSQAAALRRGYDLSRQRARVVTAHDFRTFDLLLGMDRDHVGRLRRMADDSEHEQKVRLFLEFAEDDVALDEVPDPYFGSDAGFELVLDLVEQGSVGLLRHLRGRL